MANFYSIAFWVLAYSIVVGAFALLWNDKMPSITSMMRLLAALNTKGGNLLMLSVFTSLFAIISIRTYLYIIDLSVNGKLNQDNTFALQAIAWVTGGLTTGFMGALLKTMTGDEAANGRRATDDKPEDDKSKQ